MTLPARLRDVLLGSVALASLTTADIHAACAVESIELVDRTRTRGVPYGSGSDPGADALAVRAILYRPAVAESAKSRRPDYASLLASESPEVPPADALRSALTYFGLTPESAAMERSLAAPSLCSAANGAEPVPAATTILLSALPAPFYEQLASSLADAGIATLVVRGDERDVRLLAQSLLSRPGWPAERIALAGHGAGSITATLLAMRWSAVKARISLDGFEALSRDTHPGRTAESDWKPGHERARVLLVRPRDRPHGDLDHFERAARVDLHRLEVNGLEASPWAPSAALAPAPPALASLVPGIAEEPRGFLAASMAKFVIDALTDTAATESTLPAALTGKISYDRRSALPAPAIRVDGQLDEPLWRSATNLPGEGPLQVQLAEDCDWLYVAIRATREAPFTSELFLDLDGSGGERRAADDLLLHASASLCWLAGAEALASTDCRKSEAWWEASRTVRAEDPKVAEYSIAKRRLGRSGCASLLAGPNRFRLAALAGGFGDRQLFPTGADPEKPNSWLELPLAGAAR